MTRDELIASARAMCAVPSDISEYGERQKTPTVVNTAYWAGHVDGIKAALTAIEAAGLCIVPREATGVMERAGWEVEELATPDRVYRAMIDAGRI